MEQGPALALGDMSPRDSTDIDDIIMSALNCKIQGDLHGALRGFREVLSHQFDSDFDVGRRVTAKLNIASVLNMLQRHQTALGQAVDALVDLQQQCPLLRSIIAQRPEQFYNRLDVQQILTDLAKIPECLHVLVPAAWLQCAVALQALGKVNLSELSLKRCDELERFMVAKSDSTQPSQKQPPQLNSHHAILLPQQRSQAPTTKSSLRPQTARERRAAHTPAQSKSRSRSRRPGTATTRQTYRHSRADLSVATESVESYHIAPRRPATARRSVGAMRTSTTVRPNSACPPSKATSRAGRPNSNQMNEMLQETRQVHGGLLSSILDPHETFDEQPVAQMYHGGGCSIAQDAPRLLKGQFCPPPAARTSKPPPLRDIFCPLPPPAPVDSTAAALNQPTGRPGRPRTAKSRLAKLQSNQAQELLFGKAEEAEGPEHEVPSDSSQTSLEGSKERSALGIQKIARGRAARRKAQKKQAQQFALKQIQGAIRGKSIRVEAQTAGLEETILLDMASPTLSDEEGADDLDALQDLLQEARDDDDPRESDGTEEAPPEDQYVPLPGTKEMKSLKEEMFDLESTLPVFAYQTLHAEQKYGVSDERVDLKSTARAVIKQLERLDKRNLFKLKSVTNTWLEGGNLAGIQSL